MSKILSACSAMALPAASSAYADYRSQNPSRPQQRFEAVSFGIDKDNDGNEFVMVALTGRDKKAIDLGMAL